MLARRAAMVGAALVDLVAATPALADEPAARKRRPRCAAFAHAHEQATRQKPKVIECCQRGRNDSP
jgi:hypothetical protein